MKSKLQRNFKELNYKTYEPLSSEQIEKVYDEIITCWQLFLEQNAPELILDQDYFVHKRNLFEIIRRCDERNLYYYVFHKLEDICEYKNIGLYCFWIINLKPFMVVNEKSAIYSCPNEMFALFLILMVIQRNFAEVYKDDEFKYPSDMRIRDILYEFKYCSLSRESMIAFIETFADTYGVGISYIFNRDNK